MHILSDEIYLWMKWPKVCMCVEVYTWRYQLKALCGENLKLRGPSVFQVQIYQCCLCVIRTSNVAVRWFTSCRIHCGFIMERFLHISYTEAVSFHRCRLSMIRICQIIWIHMAAKRGVILRQVHGVLFCWLEACKSLFAHCPWLTYLCGRQCYQRWQITQFARWNLIQRKTFGWIIAYWDS